MEDKIVDPIGWCLPTRHTFLELPEIQIQRGGVMYPMPQLDTRIVGKLRRGWWRFGEEYFVLLRQYGQDEFQELGPYRNKELARAVERQIYAWYTSVYNVIIRTYKATEREKNKK